MPAIHGGRLEKRLQHTVNEQIEEADGPGDQAASSINLQPGSEPRPASAKRIPNFQGAVEDLTYVCSSSNRHNRASCLSNSDGHASTFSSAVTSVA